MMALSKAQVEAIFEKEGVPGWVGWGTYGAESSYGKATNDAGHGFGLIESHYPGGTPNNNPVHNAEISAKLYKELITNSGGLGSAVNAYSGGEYTITHISELAGPGKKKGVGENLINEGPISEGVENAVVHAPKNIANAISHSPLGDIVGFIGRLFEPSFWLRVGKGIAGFLLLGFGAITLMKVLLGVDIPTGASNAAKLGATFLA